VQTPYTLAPAAPATSRFATPAPGAQHAAPHPAPVYQPGPAPLPEPEHPASYEQGGYGEAPAARTQGQPRPPQQAAPRGAARPAEPRIPGRSANLFAEPPAAPAPRKSLFGIVTGAIRGQHADLPPAPPQPAHRGEPMQHDGRGEPARAHVRQASGEESAIDIPAFLRRQSS
jgi:cell division protein FtsZ